MKKELYVRYLFDNINNNIDKYFSYIDSGDLYSFCELKGLINQNINCLILNNHVASICVTNHILERFVKLSIIKYGTLDVNYSNDELYNVALSESYNFDEKSLHKTLQEVKAIGLINEIEYDELIKIKDTYRNPYSHADTKNIVKGAPDYFLGRMYSIENLFDVINNRGLDNVSYGQKKISTKSPAISQMYIEEHAILSAFNYFKIVYNIIVDVDKRLQKLKIQE